MGSLHHSHPSQLGPGPHGHCLLSSSPAKALSRSVSSLDSHRPDSPDLSQVPQTKLARCCVQLTCMAVAAAAALRLRVYVVVAVRRVCRWSFDRRCPCGPVDWASWRKFLGYELGRMFVTECTRQGTRPQADRDIPEVKITPDRLTTGIVPAWPFSRG